MACARSRHQKGAVPTPAAAGDSQATPEGGGADESTSTLTCTAREHEAPAPSRRSVLTGGAKLVFVAPVISTFFAHQAYAANYSCYGVGHKCVDGGPNWEPCCPTLTCQADVASPTGFSCQE
ncbi:MAG: hypothetical protein KJ749_12770 [Planctomycetes bacterium]|nr:hypothetical protein [Planctomycetota bacterium]